MSDVIECHGLDTPERVCFYEQDFYVLSNFSSFQIKFQGKTFATSEHLYHWMRFQPYRHDIFFITKKDIKALPAWNDAVAEVLADRILNAPSAHEAFRLAQEAKTFQRPDWNDIKVKKMRSVLQLKASQHEYIARKLLATGDRELVENSWRDDFWGWGPNCDGQNMLGKLWMDVRDELRGAA